jgi:predicted DNA-binding transcriptional regulator YafY
MTAERDALRWDVRQRLMLLEARIIWSGSVSAEELREAFGISRAQAGKDCALYAQLYPNQLRFDAQARRYLPTDRFEPAFLRGTVNEFLQVLRNFGQVAATPLAVVAANVAPVEILEPPERAFDVRILQRATAAIREQRWLTVDYQSMNHPQPRALRLAPHALAHSGRWHVRAWSKDHDGYRDFLLSRMRGLPLLEDRAEHSGGQDWEWKNMVSVRVGAHPGLSDAQRRVVEEDYGMRSGVLEKNLRLALVPYYLRLLNVGGDDVLRPAAEQQIVLLNRDELDAYNRLG